MAKRKRFENKLHHGDNLPFLKSLASNSIDLIATDPPYCTGIDFGEYNDKWQSRDAFLSFMEKRLVETHRVLRETGALYMQCDPTASHYLKAMLDGIFGNDCFRNEIVWQRSTVKGTRGRTKTFGSISDRILFYGKEGHFVRVPRTMPEVPPEFPFADSRGNYRTPTPLYGSATLHKCKKFHWNGKNPKYGWVVSRKALDELAAQDRIHYNKRGVPYRKQYENEYKGVTVGDIWSDLPIASVVERVNYPTQKPLALYRRIVKASSNKGDLVLDPFCGSGTTLVAAELEGRKWIGCDKNDVSKLVRKRMKTQVPAGSTLFEE